MGNIYKNLEAELARERISRADLAKALEINVTTVSKKMTHPELLRLEEAEKIRTTFFPKFTIYYLFSRR